MKKEREVLNGEIVEPIIIHDESTEKFIEQQAEVLEEKVAELGISKIGSALAKAVETVSKEIQHISTEEQLAAFEKELELRDKAHLALMRYAGKALDKNDFVVFYDPASKKKTLYLTHAGAEKIKKKLGINIQWLVPAPIKVWRKDKKGEYYIYYIPAVAWHKHFGYITVICLLYTSPSPRDLSTSRMPSSA